MKNNKEITMKKTIISILVSALLLIGAYAIMNAQTPDKEFTVEELAEYDGKNGAKAYVAIDGIVYDVSLIPAWKGGKHKMGTTAGKDLTAAIAKAPHGKAVLTKLPKVGTLK
jgi:predicted heme/steroid binding protein